MNTALVAEIRAAHPKVAVAIDVVNKWYYDGAKFYKDALTEKHVDAYYDIPSRFFGSTSNMDQVYGWFKGTVTGYIGFAGIDDRYRTIEAYDAVVDAINDSMSAYGLAQEAFSDWQRIEKGK